MQTPPTRSVITQVIAYVTALHEIGHILSRHQTSREPMVRGLGVKVGQAQMPSSRRREQNATPPRRRRGLRRIMR